MSRSYRGRPVAEAWSGSVRAGDGDEDLPSFRDADEELSETLAEIYSEHGEPTAEERAWACQDLGLTA